MSPDEQMDVIVESIGTVFMIAGALYFQLFVKLQVRLLGSTPPPNKAITTLRIGAAVIATFLAVKIFCTLIRG